MSIILLALGVYILVRFTLFGLRKDRLGTRCASGSSRPLGLFAGFVDATGGGGWGPVGTPALLARPDRAAQGHRLDRHVASSSSRRRQPRLPVRLGSQGIDRTWVAALLLGGVVAAPSPRGWSGTSRRGSWVAVGGMIVLTNIRSLLRSEAGRSGRHPRRSPHPRRDRAGLGRGDRLVGPRVPHRGGPGGRDRGASPRPSRRAQPGGRLTCTRRHLPRVYPRQAVGAVACAAARTAAGSAATIRSTASSSCAADTNHASNGDGGA